MTQKRKKESDKTGQKNRRETKRGNREKRDCGDIHIKLLLSDAGRVKECQNSVNRCVCTRHVQRDVVFIIRDNSQE